MIFIFKNLVDSTEELSLDHPKHPETQEPIIMTTDLIVTTERNDPILHAKLKKTLD